MSDRTPRTPEATGTEFQVLYVHWLRPVLLEFQSRARRGLGNLGIAFLAAVAGFALAAFIHDRSPDSAWPLLPALIAFVLPFSAYAHAVHGYRAEFKRRIITPIVNFIHKGLRYEPEGRISQDEFEACRIFVRKPDKYEGEDLIAGKVGATDLRFCEVKAEYKKEDENKEEWKTLFRGFFFVADFHKDFRGLTLVLPDKTERFLGKFAQTLQGFDKRRGEIVKLEDPEFERFFKVYSSDQIEARYILSTSLMRRVLILRQNINQQVFLAFHASRVYVAVSCGRNRLEPPYLFRLAYLDKAEKPRGPLMRYLRTYLEDIHFGVNLVEELNLNTRIWTK